MRSARGLVVALALVALVAPAAADPAPTIRQCTQLGCAIVRDADGDGAHDWANVALVVGEEFFFDANVNRTILLWEAGVAAENVDDLTVFVAGEANLTGRDGSWGFASADVLVTLFTVDHETGETHAILWQYARASDSDGDNVPDRVETIPALPP